MSKLMLGAMLAAAVLTGCNTVEGIGKDVKGAGRSVEDTARENKPANRPAK